MRTTQLAAEPTAATLSRHDRRSVRKRYHFRPSVQGLHAWDVDRLIDLTAGLPTEQVPLSATREVDTATGSTTATR